MSQYFYNVLDGDGQTETKDAAQDQLPYHYQVVVPVDLNAGALQNLAVTISGSTVTGSGSVELTNHLAAIQGAVDAGLWWHNAVEMMILTENTDGTGSDTSIESAIKSHTPIDGLLDRSTTTAWSQVVGDALFDIDGGSHGTSGFADAMAQMAHATGRLSSTADVTDATGYFQFPSGDGLAITLKMTINLTTTQVYPPNVDGNCLKFTSNPGGFQALPLNIYTRIILVQT